MVPLSMASSLGAWTNTSSNACAKTSGNLKQLVEFMSSTVVSTDPCQNVFPLICAIGGGAFGLYSFCGGAVGGHAYGGVAGGYYTAMGHEREFLLFHE